MLCPKCGCNIEALKEMLKSELWEDRQAAWSIIESCESCKEAIKGGKTKMTGEETLECDTCVSLLFYEWDENKRRHCLPRCIRFFRDANDVKHPCPDYSKKKKLGGGNDKKDYWGNCLYCLFPFCFSSIFNVLLAKIFIEW